MKKHLTLTQSLLWIVLSLFIITVPTYSGFKAYLKQYRKKRTEATYNIGSLIQTGPQREALKTDYLAELIGISVDQPQNIYRFDCKAAAKRLLTSPVIKEATVKPMPPSTLFIDYTVRQPIAWIHDYSNTAIDEEKILFPVCPFFTPKKLPEIYLGLPPCDTPWKRAVQGREIDLAFKLLKLLEPFNVQTIDVSKAFAKSYGIREIVVIIEDEIIKKEAEREISYLLPRFLRLSTKNYAQELGNFLSLREQLLQAEEKELPSPTTDRIVLSPKILDFRIAHLAFIRK